MTIDIVPPQRPARMHWAALILFLSVTSLMTIGDLRVRLANSNQDDNPVFYTIFRENPARFAGDIAATYAPAFSLSSIQSWLPAVLFETFHLPPLIPVWITVFLQGSLLGLAMFRFTRLVTGRLDIAWVAVLFTYAAQTWGWNLANYGHPMTFPYAGSLCLSFLILAAADVLSGNTLRSGVLLVIAALIHPALTLLMLFIIAIYWLITLRIGRTLFLPLAI
jgi:hypothetical protein